MLGWLLAGPLACRNAVAPWGATPAEARQHAEGALTAFTWRFTNVQRDPRFAAARPILGKYALVPSRLYRDSSLWTIHDTPDSSQGLYLDATFENGRYFFASRPAAPSPRRLGDERHFMRLRKLGDGDFEWVTIVDHAIGSVPAPRVGDAVRALVTAFEGRSGGAVLADMHGAFPRTAQHMGRLLRIDSLRTAPFADGSTSLQLAIAWQPDSIRQGAPAFAAWVDKYVMPTRWRMDVTDPQGVRYVSVTGVPGTILIRARARNGQLVPLAGAPRPLPDTLRVELDALAKFRIFHVGFSGMVGDFIVERGEHEAGFFFRFRREPEWHFPLAIDYLIKTPLRRPFEGRGTELRLAVRDDMGAQSMSQRYARTVVNESAIMRWLGNLGASAFGDFEGASEAEENRFLAGMFDALRRDIAALVP